MDEENGNIKVVPAKTTLASLYGTESSGPRNFVIPKGKWKLVLRISGTFHDLLASETAEATARDGYYVKNKVVEFFSTFQALKTSKPTRFNYPHWHAVGTHQEFEGVLTKLEFDDEAGVGSGEDYPVFPYTMEFTVGKSENPLVA